MVDVKTNTLPIGCYLQEYQLKKILGIGGFGITYLAYDEQLNKQVAIKEYYPNELAVRDKTYSVYPKSEHDKQSFTWGLERFIQEARTLASFNHPNIIKIYRFFEANNTAYFVMEYEQGQSLATALNAGGTATEEELMTILPSLLDGLATIHKANFLHRDIKPSNIYIRDKDNTPVLLDFGSARIDLISEDKSITSLVTPGYAPFEQYDTDGIQQGAWTDIYALGAVLYRCIGGSKPIEATKRIGALIRNQTDPLIPATIIGYQDYSEQLLKGIDWALQVREHDRPKTVEMWAKLLLSKPKKQTPNIKKTKTITSSHFILLFMSLMLL
jgi:serine/threonine protein kinase